MTTLADTERMVGAFKTDLLRLSDAEVVQRHITFGDCFALSNDLYFQLKTAVADEFQLHHTEILIVGSAKLGFSIVEHKRYQTFGDRSDIDIAIISPDLFNRIWLEAYNYWLSGAYWPDQNQFEHYLFRGWLRPDKLPPERSFETRSRWWNFFRELTASGTYGPYKISAGLYKSWQFLESYQTTCISQCRDELGGGR